MNSEVDGVSVLKLTEKSSSRVDDVVAREFPLTIVLNNQELVTLLCSPANMGYLAVGFLFSEGLLRGKDDIKKILVDEERGVARVETEGGEEVGRDAIFKRLISSGCGRGAHFYSAADVRGRVRIESRVEVSPQEVLALVNEFQRRSGVYRATGGVHGAALCDSTRVLVFGEDIGRHNALDKVFGECILNDIATDDRIVVTSGRMSSEMLTKVARGNVPIIVSRSAPTDMGLKLASDLGVTIVGFARGRRMNVYTHDWRIVTDEEQRC